MSKQYITGLIILLLFSSCKKQPTKSENPTFLEKLNALSGVEIIEIDPQPGFDREFEIFIEQPLDHQNPDGQKFSQQLFLLHRENGEDLPVVFMPSGYTARASTVSELSGLLNANQIYVAHRFMTGARPSQMDWQYLTVEQAAADFHRIVELFKQIYKGKWINYGASKNGVTALLHKRFYPNDITATVAKVAPISFAIDDPRYDAFLENVGTEAERNKIEEYQIALLKKREGILPRIRQFIYNSTLTYSLNEGVILEFEACEFFFSFWQVTDHDVMTIPDSSSSAQVLYDYLESGGYLPYYSDEAIDFYEPFYYQMFTELGYYSLNRNYLNEFLVSVPDISYSYFAPKGVTLTFKPEVMQDFNQWLQTEGNNIIYIYGALDPWTAGAIESIGQTNSLKIIQAGANHSVYMADLDERDLVYSTLEEWLGLEIDEAEASVSSFFNNENEDNFITNPY